MAALGVHCSDAAGEVVVPVCGGAGRGDAVDSAAELVVLVSHRKLLVELLERRLACWGVGEFEDVSGVGPAAGDRGADAASRVVGVADPFAGVGGDFGKAAEEV